jgi:hypothetical protein
MTILLDWLKHRSTTPIRKPIPVFNRMRHTKKGSPKPLAYLTQLPETQSPISNNRHLAAKYNPINP